MRAVIQIRFKRIAGIKVNAELLKKTPQLFDATKKTITILTHQIKKYFQDKKIKTGVSFELYNDQK